MPSLGMITINTLASADKVIIPIQSEFLAAKCMSHLMNTLLSIRKKINPQLKVGEIILTIVDGKTNLSKDIIRELKETYGTVFKLFNTKIPKASKAAVEISHLNKKEQEFLGYCTKIKEKDR